MASDGSRTAPGISRRRALTVGGAALAAVGVTLPVPDLGGRPSGPSESGPPGGRVEGAENGLFDRLHAAGITGEGVRVGIVDPTGFDPGREAIRNRVAALEWFGSDPPVVDVSHGTAAATTVSTAAPDADLYLAGFEDDEGFERAVAWTRDEELDVLLTPFAAHGVAAGNSRVSRAAGDAVDAGLVVVAPTGNAARGHWSRPISPAELTTAFQSLRIGVRSLADGSPEGRLVAWVTDDGPTALELGLALVERTDQGDGRNLIALSRSVGDDRGHRLTATLDGGDYWLELQHRSGEVTGIDPDGFRVEVTTPTHRLVPAQPAGSIAAPATAPDVLAVGATTDTGTSAAPYSGRGPTADGRAGVDLVAPPRPWTGAGPSGTSAAAARAAGIAALVRGRYSAPPRRVVELLRATATDVGGNGVGLATGAGRLDAELAIQRARARARAAES
ncbi:MAG: S8 family serine peptidase [Halopenitus sp.]